MNKRIYLLLLLLTIPILGVKEIYVTLGSDNTDLELSAVVRQPSTDYLWDDVNGFEATKSDPNSGIDLTESSNTKGTYYGTFPASISAGKYDIIIYDSNATLLDFNDTQLIAYSFPWDGSAEITLYTIWQDTDAYDSNDEFASAVWNADVGSYGEPDTYGSTLENLDEDMNLLKTDWEDGGRLDLILDGVDSNLGLIHGIVKSGGTGDVNAVWAAVIALQADLDNETDGLGALKSLIDAVPTAAENRDAVFAKTGITEGGTWTFEDLTKYQAAWLMGKWTDSNDVDGYDISDAEDPNTTVLQYESSGSEPYKSVTVP